MRSDLIVGKEPTYIAHVQSCARTPPTNTHYLWPIGGHVVHVQLGCHIKHRASGGTHKQRLCPRAEPSTIPHVKICVRSPKTSRICNGAYVATLSTCHFVHVQIVQRSGRSPQASRICSSAYVSTVSTCHFVHVQLDSNTCHSCSFYMDLHSLHDTTLRARNLNDERIIHDVYHPRSRASSPQTSRM